MSRKRLSVAPYAKALFEVALAESRADAIGRELATTAALVDAHAELTPFLAHPAVPAHAKKDVIERVASEAGASAPLLKLLALMGDRDRLSLVGELNAAYQQRLLQHQGVVEAHVTTAVPLTADRAAAVTAGLERATGKKVRLTTAVDPTILGGVVTRIGSRVFDGSIARQLERMHDQLSASGI
ncbi:MAG: ATP synthase F1 subunit delta [Vicinamibacterales bacterium]